MKCPLCQKGKLRLLVKPFRGRQIYKCHCCINAITIPAPSVSYVDDDFYTGTVVEWDRFAFYANQLLDFFKRKVKGKKLLEVGCSGGVFILKAIEAGFDAQGIEPSVKAVEFCRKQGLKVKKGLFWQSSYSPESFEVIVVSHVLEHVVDPLRFLRIAWKLLRNNGFLVLAQTNYQGSIPKLLGKFWEGWVIDKHLWHFSSRGLAILLNNTSFTLVDAKILPLGYRLQWRWGNQHIIANNIYQCVNYLIGRYRLLSNFQGDQLYLLAQKKLKKLSNR